MILKIGHRGAMGYAPENTLSSFKKALELKVDMIEFDVHNCKTGELIVIHNKKVNRTTNGKGFVYKKSLKELKKLDAGKKEKIPTLKEVLDLINKKTKVNIELKDVNIAQKVDEIIKYYIKNNGWNYEQFIVSSYNYKELKRLNKINNNIKIGLLKSNNLIGLFRSAKRINAYSLHLSVKKINQKIIKRAHEKGLKVYVETVNEKSEVERMKQIGVDGIFSNFPDRI